MKMRNCFASFIGLSLVLAIGWSTGLIAERAALAAPWQMITFKKIDAEPSKTYSLAESNGPWMIMVTTFRDKQAEQQAHQLVYELRKQYKLNAFMHKQSYDFTNKVVGNGFNPDGTPRKMNYFNKEKIDEFAVLVGDFRSVDDAEGRKTLAMLKAAEPDCMKSASGKAADNSFVKLRREAEEMFTGAAAKTHGPLAGAFMTTNPLLPKDYYVSKGIDQFVVDMNKGIEHSLLDCKGRYTVKIATFTGHVEINQRKIQELEKPGHNESGKDDDPLVLAYKKAHAITEDLRKKGIEAYEFHDRYSSIVTIGSFNSVGNPRADGKTEINPQIYEIMKKYGPDPKTLASSQAASEQINAKTMSVTIDRKSHVVMLDVQPMPVEVPQRSIGADYQQTTMMR